MSAFTAYFKPKGGRFGLQLVHEAVEVGTIGASPFVASSTFRIILPVPYRKSQLLSLSLQVAVAAAGSAALTVRAYKRTGGADTALTATSDCTATQFTTLQKAYNWPITGTDANTIFQAGDLLVVDLVAAGTVTTQPQLTICASIAVLN